MNPLAQQIHAARKPPITPALLAAFQAQPERLQTWIVDWAMADVSQLFTDTQNTDALLFDEIRQQAVTSAASFCSENPEKHSLEKLIDALEQWREHEFIETTLVNSIFAYWQNDPKPEVLTFWFWLVAPILLPHIQKLMRYKNLEQDLEGEMLIRLLKKALSGSDPQACADGHGFFKVLRTTYLGYCVEDIRKKNNKSLVPNATQHYVDLPDGPTLDDFSWEQAKKDFDKPRTIKDKDLNLHQWLETARLPDNPAAALWQKDRWQEALAAVKAGDRNLERSMLFYLIDGLNQYGGSAICENTLPSLVHFAFAGHKKLWYNLFHKLNALRTTQPDWVIQLLGAKTWGSWLDRYEAPSLEQHQQWRERVWQSLHNWLKQQDTSDIKDTHLETLSSQICLESMDTLAEALQEQEEFRNLEDEVLAALNLHSYLQELSKTHPRDTLIYLYKEYLGYERKELVQLFNLTYNQVRYAEETFRDAFFSLKEKMEPKTKA